MGASSNIPPDAKYLTIPQTAAHFQVSEGFIRRMVGRNDLPAIRLGRRVLIPRSAVEALGQGDD